MSARVIQFKPDMRVLVRHLCSDCGHWWQQPVRAERCLKCASPNVEVEEVTHTEATRI